MFIRKSTREDIQTFIPSDEDFKEARAGGHDPFFPEPEHCVTLDSHGHAIAIGGNQGDQVWFVTSRKVVWLSQESRKEFRKCIIEYRDSLLETYPVLWNYVWLGNKSHIRFLKTIGAVFENEFTRDGQFQLFTIRR